MGAFSDLLNVVWREMAAVGKEEGRKLLHEAWQSLGQQLFGPRDGDGVEEVVEPGQDARVDLDMGLPWIPWTPWNDVANDGITLPTGPGVYEVKRVDEDGPLLDIGKADNLQRRTQ